MDVLTERQRQIVELKSVEDLTNAEIGWRLGIAPHTVKNHVVLLLARVGLPTMHGVCYRYGYECGYRKGIEDAAGLVAMRSDEV